MSTRRGKSEVKRQLAYETVHNMPTKMMNCEANMAERGGHVSVKVPKLFLLTKPECLVGSSWTGGPDVTPFVTVVTPLALMDMQRDIGEWDVALKTLCRSWG